MGEATAVASPMKSPKNAIMNVNYKILFCVLLLIVPFIAIAAGGPYTETGIYKGNSNLIVWAEDCNVVRGLKNIADPNLGYVFYGSESDATGQAEGTISDVVSLGDGGIATLTFDETIYITNGAGYDFAVFENGFPVDDSNNFHLELAFVEVSSDGNNFFGFDAVSLTLTNVQVGNETGLDHTNVHNFAGKHPKGYGTQFDLEELKDVSGLLDVNSITHVRIIDVVGFVEPADFNDDGIVDIIDFSIFAAAYMNDDDDGNWNQECDIYREWVEVDDYPGYYEPPDGLIDLYDFQEFMDKWLDENDYASCDINGHQINDPWPTPFEQGWGGFDLDAVGVMNTRLRE